MLSKYAKDVRNLLRRQMNPETGLCADGHHQDLSDYLGWPRLSPIRQTDAWYHRKHSKMRKKGRCDPGIWETWGDVGTAAWGWGLTTLNTRSRSGHAMYGKPRWRKSGVSRASTADVWGQIIALSTGAASEGVSYVCRLFSTNPCFYSQSVISMPASKLSSQMLLFFIDL